MSRLARINDEQGIIACLRHTHIRTILLTIVYEGLLVGFWFIDHACAGSFFWIAGFSVYGPYMCSQALRWYMLFLGMIQ